MIIYIQCNENNKVLHVGTSPIGENPIEVEVDSMEIFDNPSMFIYENGQIVKDDTSALAFEKQKKIAELDFMCSETLNGKFTADVNGVTYSFACDAEAQNYFEKCDRAFDKGRMTTIKWTAWDLDGNVVRLDLDATLFEVVYMGQLEHIQNSISKFRDILQPQVESAITSEEIQAITW